MIKLFLTFIFIILFTCCYGQYRHVLVNDTSGNDKYPFAVIKADSQKEIKTYSYVIDYGYLIANKIDSSGKYSNIGDNIEIYDLRPGTKLSTTEQLLDKYHVKQKDRNLPIYIDSIIIRHKETACFQLSAIVSVKVKTEKNTHSKYINIHTIHHPDNSFSDVYINASYTRPNSNN
jgi:hypothetical protein